MLLTTICCGCCGGVGPLLSADHVRVVDRGYNQSIVQCTREVLNDSGTPMTRSSQWTQLEDGLNYWDQDTQSWGEAREEIQLIPGGALALKGQHRTIFSTNVNDPNGALDIEIRNTVRLRSSVLALGYFDPLNGSRATIGTVHDAAGELIPPNQVIYRNAFEGLKADVVYTYRRRGVEADIVLREIPPPPEGLGLHPETTRLEVYTEFFDPPRPLKTAKVLASVGDPALRAAMAEPDWVDEELDFGVNHIGDGRAFAWAARDVVERDPDDFAPVGKHWLQAADGRTLLVESADYLSLFDELVTLPGRPDRMRELQERARAWAGTPRNNLRVAALRRYAASVPIGNPRSLAGSFAVPRRLAAEIGFGNLSMANRIPLSEPGIVLDWSTISTGQTNYSFRGDRTYLVTGNCNFYGTTRLEGGAIIKFARHTNDWIGVNLRGPFECRTSAYLPAVFTAEDDNLIGESITPGAPNPTNQYAAYSIRFIDTASPIYLHDVRIKYQYRGPYFHGNNPDNLVRNVQVMGPLEAFRVSQATRLRMENCLVDAIRPGGFVFYGDTNSTFLGSHLTIHRSPNLRNGYATLPTLVLTNSLLVAITNVQPYSGDGNFRESNAAGIFSGVGAGNFYLAAASPHRNAGLSAINPDLVREFQRLTTYPPTVLSSDITVDTTLSPRATCDTDTPDLGYHYPPLDYCVSSVNVANCSLSLTHAVTIGVFGSVGFNLQYHSTLNSTGIAELPNRLVRFDTVQEASTNWGGAGVDFTMINLDSAGLSGDAVPGLTLRFTQADHLGISPQVDAGTHSLFRVDCATPVTPLDLKNCEFSGVSMVASACGTDQGASIVNCLFERCDATVLASAVGPANGIELRNNLFVGGKAYLEAWTTTNLVVRDNLFEVESLTKAGTPTASHNGFGAGLSAFGSNAKTSLAADFVPGPLGDYYYPCAGSGTSLASLKDAGSSGAADAGLYHFTTLADQSKELNSVVDIGYHYPAAGPSSDGLVAHWRFNERSGTTAFDSSTNGLNGLLQNGPSWDFEGRNDGCLAFDGVDDYLHVSYATPLDIGKNNADFSILFWMNLLQDATGTWRTVMEKGDNATTRTPSIFLWNMDNRLSYRVTTTTNWNSGGDSVGTMPVGKWTHVAIIKAGLDLSLYLNGVLDSRVTLPAPVVHNSNGIVIGSCPGYWPANIRLDDFMIYARAISPVEIAGAMGMTPIDTDGDGTADYLEDANNNGNVDSGERDWTTSQSGLSGPVGLLIFTPLK